MRKLLNTAVAVAIMGLGVASANASSGPYNAVKEIIASPYTSNYNDTTSTNLVAGAGDSAAGAEFAGLVHANEIGAATVGDVNAFATAIVNYSVSSGNVVVGGPYSGTNKYAADVLYGFAYANKVTGNVSYKTEVTDYLTYVAGTFGGASNVADIYANDVNDPTTSGLYDLSHVVLASNLVGHADAAAYRTALASALGNFDPATYAGNTYTTNDGTSPTQALAISLFALASTGSGPATGSGSAYSGDTLATLASKLSTLLINNDSGETGDTAQITEDISYGILALKAYMAQSNTTTYNSLVASLMAELTASVGIYGNTSVPLYVDGSGNFATAQYAGIALQALPEPATLSLLGLGAMGLLARRRRGNV